MTVTQINKVFALLGAHIYNYKKNHEILKTFKHDNVIAIVLEGSAEIKNMDYNGNEIILETLEKNSLIGTNFSFINDPNTQIIANEDSRVVVISYIALTRTKNLNYKYFNLFLRNLFDIINSKLKVTNERSRILEKKQIRDRLLEFFEIEYRKSHLQNITLPFTFKELSDFIAVNRSAMFRELRNLKDEKLITVNGRKVTLLYK